MKNTSDDLKFTYTLTLVFFVLTLFNILHHEMWRDELEAWMIARDASSLHELVENMRYQGHPMLWHLILYPITKITRNPVAMQLVHLVIATASVFVFLRFSPFSKLLKGLFVFGYFPFFEYATISRNYAIGILFLFLFCAYFSKDFKNRNYILLSIILFLMCQCNALSTVLAIALAITLFFEPLLSKDFIFYKSWRFYASILIFTAGLVLSIIQMKPPVDSSFYNPVIIGRNVTGKIYDQISALWNVFVPVPRVQMHFWNTNFLSYVPLKAEIRYALRLIFSFGLFVVSFFIMLKKKIPAFYYCIAVIGLTTFSYVLHEGTLRHKGHYYFAFISALWLSSYYPSEEYRMRRIFNLADRFKNAFLIVILSLSFTGALIANTINDLYPFSTNKETANYIKQNGLQNMPIAGFWAATTAGVTAYLNRPFYDPVQDKVTSFNVWKSAKNGKMDVFKNVMSYVNSVKTDVLLIVTEEPLPNDLVEVYGFNPLRSFTNSIVKDETFYLYRVRFETP
ncbi:MAG: hypothetical protein HQK88_17080 [Nitrospirae bacterium]|nr:hypothetical protein [Nitrospirota bacterium]